jgi:ABC-type xylose transport system permease subunit
MMLAAAKDPSVGSILGFFAVLLANMYLGWWAWRSKKPDRRYKRLPAWGVATAGFGVLALSGLLYAIRNTRVDFGKLIVVIVAGLLFVIGASLLMLGILNLVKPFSWLEAGAGYEWRRRRRARTRR